jgi:hypothetical protein
MADLLEFTTAHEVCHQWWGLGVGSDQIDHPWQDESLTNYCSVLYFRWQHGEEAAKKQVDMQLMLPYSTGRLMAGGDMIVDTPSYGFASQTQYTATIYSKGALFFQALEAEMGQEAFEESLREYYGKYSFREATGADLMACFAANGKNAQAISALHQRWIKEKHADEDIAVESVPGMDMLNDLLDQNGIDMDKLDEMLKQYMPEGMELDNLEDLFEDFMPGGTTPVIPMDPDLEPVLPI